MQKLVKIQLIGLFAGSVVPVAQALAVKPGDGSIPADRQAQLLERFGEDGIDANEDGVLTREEVRAYFEENGPIDPGFGPRFGRSRFGPAGEGRPGHAGPFGPGGLVGMFLARLEHLEAATPPEQFDLSRHPEADVDGDGVLSDTEWTQFASQARAQLLSRMADRVPGLDADKNGDVSDEELDAFKAQHESRVREHILSRHPDADSDGDCVLSDAELAAFDEMRETMRREMMLEHHPEADVDGDGVLSDEEVRAIEAERQAHHFEQLLKNHPEADLDGDGVLSEEEAEAFRAEHQGPLRQHGPRHGDRIGRQPPRD